MRDSARKGNVERLKKYLKLGVDYNSKDESGYTALHWASINGREECVKALIRVRPIGLEYSDKYSKGRG